MSYVVGTFCFNEAGIPKIFDLEVIQGPRPKGSQDIPGCDPDVLRTMHGTTRARVGTGCALILNDITRLAWSSPRVMGNLRKKVPELFDSGGELVARQGLVGLWRDGGAGGTFWCADVCAGVAESTDLYVAAAKEAVEVGFYQAQDQWARLGRIGPLSHPVSTNLDLIHPDGESIDRVINQATREEWGRLLCRNIGESEQPSIVLDLFRPDEWDEPNPTIPSAVATTEPENGSVEIVYILGVKLPEVDGGWRLRDTEHMKIKDDYIALNRRPVLTVHIKEQAPVLLGFGSDGLDPHATIARLDGSNLETMLNSKTRTVLETLGWLPQS